MYNERKDSFSIKGLIVQILLIVLFVFILIWLFPTKGNVNENLDGVNTKFDVLTNRIFNENLQTMKEAAIFYYTTSRLPQNVNDVKSMTLRKMLEEKLLIEFKDANNKSCDLDKSYVEITKLEDEYLLKVNLSCTDNDAYILVHLGCYDYCSTDVCENKDVEPSKPVENTTPTPTPDVPTPDIPVPQPTCTYKYQKVVSNSVWSNWSDWSTTEVTETETKKVDTEEESKTETKEVITEVEKTYKDMDKPITKDVEVVLDELSVSYCSSFTSQLTPTGEKKYEWIDQGTKYYVDHPKDYTDSKGITYKFKYEGETPADCADCSNGVLYIYRKYQLKIYDVVTKDEVCGSWTTITAPIFITIPEIVGYETYTVLEPVSEMITETIVTKYYRYKTLSTTYNTLTEWSSVQNDQNLIGQGYKYITSVCK